MKALPTMYQGEMPADFIWLRGTFMLRSTAIRALDMPIGAYLDDGAFDPETIRLTGIGFEMALASLCSTPGYTDPVREAVARKIIELAKAGERDPECLCEGALKHFALGVGIAAK
jgi:hypothetical protein